MGGWVWEGGGVWGGIGVSVGVLVLMSRYQLYAECLLE